MGTVPRTPMPSSDSLPYSPKVAHPETRTAKAARRRRVKPRAGVHRVDTVELVIEMSPWRKELEVDRRMVNAPQAHCGQAAEGLMEGVQSGTNATVEGFPAAGPRRSGGVPALVLPLAVALSLLLFSPGPWERVPGPVLLSAQEIPPPPSDGRSLLHDEAGMASPSDRVVLRAVLEEALDAYGTAMVVVTLEQMADHGAPEGMPVEDFARAWFDAWAIGAVDEAGAPQGNRGILLLVARDDGMARIELGGEWGSRWDGHSEQIMDDVLVPRLSREAWSEALLEGGWALLDMARAGPDGDAPELRAATTEGATGEGARATELLPGPDGFMDLVPRNPVPDWLRVLLAVGGIAAILMGASHAASRRDLLGLGAALLLGALSVWLLLLGLFVVARWWLGWGHDPHRHRGGRGGGGRGGGGGFGGGSSGGGGATGRF
ncbi:MAG: TPM domain-containing protein [Gemmatimonadales bacterium]|nr:MAG: TPM domain-containing protein [Gemmatimonadales bacterium]